MTVVLFVVWGFLPFFFLLIVHSSASFFVKTKSEQTNSFICVLYFSCIEIIIEVVLNCVVCGTFYLSLAWC